MSEADTKKWLEKHQDSVLNSLARTGASHCINDPRVRAAARAFP